MHKTGSMSMSNVQMQMLFDEKIFRFENVIRVIPRSQDVLDFIPGALKLGSMV